MGKLDGSVAIITGGAGGIGAANGRLFCAEGARVVLVDLDAAAMEGACGAARRSQARDLGAYPRRQPAQLRLP